MSEYSYRKQIDSTKELGEWYDKKYLEMGDGWHTPAEECQRHLDALGVPFDMQRTLLDVGAGAGHFLAEAQKRVQCFGLEISDEGIRCAAKRGVLCMARYSIEDIGVGDIGQYDYIVSIGSLEHIVDLDKALDNIHNLLKPEGKFYFYCPNELWAYFDQPNERTMTDAEWQALFAKHGLRTVWSRRHGDKQDNTAFCGVRADNAGKQASQASFVIPANPSINAGSGQRPFDSKLGWVNIDVQDKYGPDLVADWNNLGMFADNSVECVVSHHSLEHVGLGEADGFINEALRVLKPGGSLLIFVPNMKILAQRWMLGQIDDYTYFVNVYGAYMGNPADRHAWGFSADSLKEYLRQRNWTVVKPFNWRTIPGADIAKDWWILAIEAVK